MSHSELLLEKHAKTFIDPKHDRKAARGILFDGEGSAYATDGIQALKVDGFPAAGFPWVQTLTGKVIEENFDNLLRIMQGSFSKALASAGQFLVKDFKSAADQLLSIQKIEEKNLPVASRGTYRTALIGAEGKLVLEYVGDEVEGVVEIGEYAGEDFRMHMNCKRLLDCLSVFTGSHVELLHRERQMLRFESEGVATLVLPIV